MIRTLVVAEIAFVAGSFVSGQTHPAAKIVSADAFDVIGIKCRTNNANEASGKGCIGQQWERLVSEGVLRKIPSRADNSNHCFRLCCMGFDFTRALSALRRRENPPSARRKCRW